MLLKITLEDVAIGGLGNFGRFLFGRDPLH
jgi:hypothetical protein